MVGAHLVAMFDGYALRHYREAISYALYKHFPTARSLLVVGTSQRDWTLLHRNGLKSKHEKCNGNLSGPPPKNASPPKK